MTAGAWRFAARIAVAAAVLSCAGTTGASGAATGSPRRPAASASGEQTWSELRGTVDVRAAEPTSRVVHPGDLLQYTLTAKNNGPAVARNVIATDELPASLTFVSSADGCTADGRTVSCGPEAVLAVGASKSWTFLARLDPAYLGDGSDLGNVAVVSSDTGDSDSGNNSTPPVVPPGPIVPAADLAITKKPVGDAPVPPGATFDYVLTVTNNGPSRAGRVQVTDTLPAPLAFVSSPDGCTADGQSVNCPALAGLDVGASHTWTVTVRLDADYSGDGSDVRNRAAVSSDTDDPNPANNTAEAGLPGGRTPRAVADLAVEKTATGPQVAPGESVPYTITVTDNGPGDAEHVVLTDRVPAPLTYLSSQPAGCRYDAATRELTCPVADRMRPGEQIVYTLALRLDPAYRGDGSDAVNTATVTAATVDPNTADNTDSAPLPSGGHPAKPKRDVAVQARLATDRATPGESVRLETRLHNNGPSATGGQGVQTVTLPAGLTFAGPLPPGCTASSPTEAVCAIPPGLVPDSADVTYGFTVLVSPDAGADLVLTGHSHVDEPGDDVPADDDAGFTLRTGAPSADLALAKHVDLPDGKDRIDPGDTVSYTLTVTDRGPSAAVNVRVADPLPDGLRFVSASDGCAPSGRVVDCGPVARLEPGEQAVFRITVRLDPAAARAGTTVENLATVSADTADPDLSNNSGRAALRIGAAAGPTAPPLPATGSGPAAALAATALAALLAGGTLAATARRRHRRQG
ncbi:DUF11 domain-containing protein [Kitasatospora sp. NPDC004531]